ncbi:energy transducer TonB [Massilia horti]|uniref:Energy transducer TonB n=1 Tax=Massilia horti TaxID=2562153 RepID=A0A4Y9SV37_9BURK|nr:energy transducer TonB [Massilia horti]TFW30298.1 energy transducer TonB [Massilia horti]
MHFSHVNHAGANKASKFALVAGIHLAVGVAFVHSLNTRHISLPKMEDLMVTLVPELTPPPPPPPPPEPPRPMPRVAPPQIVVPQVEVEVPPPVEQPVVQATTVPDPNPAPVAQTQVEAPPAAQPSPNTGVMRTAVLADTNSCATPAYPASSLRNGDTGTVTLALMVGADGKVTGSRIQKSSGHRELDKAAINALSLCRFKPAMNNGVAEAGWAQIAYDWKLED